MMRESRCLQKETICNPSMYAESTSLLQSTILAVGFALLKLMITVLNSETLHAFPRIVRRADHSGRH
jgi:hypothetical protein